MAMNLGARVEAMRKLRGLSQDELAKQAQITQGLLSRIEHDKTRNPGANALKGLARALGVSIDYLVGLYDESHRQMAGTTP
jgi:transcriptional regulator with XRE-family HTH domain